MIQKSDFPILEFDTNPVAKINPENLTCGEKWPADKLIITFFSEALNKLLEEKRIEVFTHIGGENPFDIYRFVDAPDILILLGQIGCPACAGNLDAFQAFGIKKVMFCGGGGVLDRSIKVGEFLVVEGAIRDEGFSYHYLPPARVVNANPAVVKRITGYLDEKGFTYLTGLCWTTDAMLRETADRIELRKSEGAKIVEMEQAGCLAVAQFRGFDYGAIIYGGDDVAGDEWDDRGWGHRYGIRFNLIMLCKELVKVI
ncbi:MAG: nucleoside phosphorylase [Treponema sp.]|nr:nucleoside phosphorylase [Candidatus Treponema caballi]